MTSDREVIDVGGIEVQVLDLGYTEQFEKSTGKSGQLNAVPTAPKAAIPTMANGKVSHRSDPTCEACQ